MGCSTVPAQPLQSYLPTRIKDRGEIIVVIAPIVNLANVYSGEAVGTPRGQGGAPFRRIAIGSSPVEEGVGAVVSIFLMTLEEQVQMTVTVKVRRQNSGGRVGGDSGHSVGCEATGSIPVNIGRITAGVSAVIAAEYQVEVPVLVQIRRCRLHWSKRRKN